MIAHIFEEKYLSFQVFFSKKILLQIFYSFSFSVFFSFAKKYIPFSKISLLFLLRFSSPLQKVYFPSPIIQMSDFPLSTRDEQNCILVQFSFMHYNARFHILLLRILEFKNVEIRSVIDQINFDNESLSHLFKVLPLRLPAPPISEPFDIISLLRTKFVRAELVLRLP